MLGTLGFTGSGQWGFLSFFLENSLAWSSLARNYMKLISILPFLTEFDPAQSVTSQLFS